MVKNDKQNDDFKKISWLKLIGDKNRKCDIIEVLLFPYRNNLPDLKFTGLEGGGKKIEYDGYEDEIYYSSGLKNKNLSTDAEVVIIRKRENRIIYAAIIAGTFLEYQKNIIYKNNKKDNYEKIF
jgi:hypothetical protein